MEGVTAAEPEHLSLRVKAPLETGAEDVLWADALILGTTENFGYMAGRTKDFFERIYYPCLESRQGLPFALYIRAGSDGTGTRISIDKIVTGLKWKTVVEPLVLRGDWDPDFATQCRELGMTVAAGLDAGIF